MTVESKMNSTIPMLYIFAGLPGVGKSMLAQALAQHTGAVYLRIDTIEQALHDLCQTDVQGEGYRLAYRIASDNLKLGLSVVTDSCNPVAITRKEWEGVARSSNAHFTNIEVVCSDMEEHQRRIETRKSNIPGLVLPTWQEVLNREYHPWTKDRIIIDTVSKSEANSFKELLSKIKTAGYLP